MKRFLEIVEAYDPFSHKPSGAAGINGMTREKYVDLMVKHLLHGGSSGEIALFHNSLPHLQNNQKFNESLRNFLHHCKSGHERAFAEHIWDWHIDRV